MDSKLAIKEYDLPYKNSPRNQPISKVTIHHYAGIATPESYAAIAKEREESCNYLIDKDADVTQWCPEGARSWCSSSSWNDNRAVTIEVSNSEVGGEWPVSDKVYNKLIDLCVDICQRNGMTELIWTGDKTGSLTTHDMFAATACPGPYLKSRMPKIAAEVTRRLKADTGSDKSTKEIKMETPKKTVSQLAEEVIRGDWGNNPDRKKRLTDAGYDYEAVQKEVDARLVKPEPKKSIDEIAKECIRGDWGNGITRKTKLNAAGYKYDEVQKRVDEILNETTKNSNSETKATKLAAAHSFNPSKYAGTYSVIPEKCNIRLVPGNMSNAAVLTTISTKTKVKCYGYYEVINKSVWLLIAYGNKVGFVDISLLRKI